MVYYQKVMSSTTKLTFFKSYYRMGWWAARMPKTSDWGGHQIDRVGFGVTQTQAERELRRLESDDLSLEGSEIAA